MFDYENIFNSTLTQNELSSIRREFHMYPEVSGNEFKTVDRICSYLDRWNIQYEKCLNNTGVVAIIKGTYNGKTVGVRADIDALPIQEQNEICYRSKNDGAMHACGHDAHTTIALGTALMIKSIEPKLKGNVKIFFQPNEEDTGGAERIIKEGFLTNPEVDYILGLHVISVYKSGQVGIKYRKMYATSDMIKLRVSGKSCHGAQPQNGIDAIVVASQIINAVQTVVSRRTSPTNSAVCTFGTIQGGNARNQVADYVELNGIIRTLDIETRVKTRNIIRNICEGIAESMGAKAEFEVVESYMPLINNDFVTDIVKDNAVKLLGSDNVIIETEPQLGVEDFAYFAAAKPSCFFHLGCNHTELDLPPIHNSKFDIDELCLSVGVKLQVKNILALLD